MIVWCRYFLLLFIATIIACINMQINPNRPAWSETTLAEGEISVADTIDNEFVLWLDARPLEDYEHNHIPGALMLNEDDWQALLPEFLSLWQPGLVIVVYCSSQQCQSSHSVAERLRDEVGLEDVYVLKGGWETWQSHVK